MIQLAHTDIQSSTWKMVLPDLTSMLDILFILLVFFMLTIGTVYQSLNLKLPSSVMQEIPQEDIKEHIMLEVGHDQYALDGKIVTEFESFKTLVLNEIKNKPHHEVIIAGDKDISMEKLLTVLTYLQLQGIKAANILMQEKDST